MKVLVTFAAALVAVVLSVGTAQASDPIAVYALIDKAVFEPNADQPERIQLWGVFAMAKPDDRNYYEAPRRGYLYFELPGEKKETARTEWNDLKSVAGTSQVVAFGSRSQMKARVRKTEEKADNPDVYPLGFGVTKVRSRQDYAPVKSLLEYSGH